MGILPQVYIGVDVSKNHLDIYINPIGKHFRLDNSKKEIGRFIKDLRAYEVMQIGCEASGGYEKPLVQLIKKSGLRSWIIDPRRVKGFAVSHGLRAKTDKIDAKKIAEFVVQNDKEFDMPTRTDEEEKLQALINRRKDLTKLLGVEKNRLQQASHALCLSHIKKIIRFFEHEIEIFDEKIEELVNSSEILSKKSAILESIPGVGRNSAALLLSFIPELGHLSNAKISALIGVCP